MLLDNKEYKRLLKYKEKECDELKQTIFLMKSVQEQDVQSPSKDNKAAVFDYKMEHNYFTANTKMNQQPDNMCLSRMSNSFEHSMILESQVNLNTSAEIEASEKDLLLQEI